MTSASIPKLSSHKKPSVSEVCVSIASWGMGRGGCHKRMRITERTTESLNLLDPLPPPKFTAPTPTHHISIDGTYGKVGNMIKNIENKKSMRNN